MSSGGRKSLDNEPATVTQTTVSVAVKPTKHAPVRGKPVSGRVWKEDLGLPQRASSKNKVASLRSSWAVKERRRAEMNAIKERSKAAKAEAEEAYRAEAARIKASRERRAANSLKNVKYQVVTNTAKLRQLNKQQKKNYMKLADINKQ